MARHFTRHGEGALWPALLISFVVYCLIAVAYTYPLVLHLDSGVLQGLDTNDAYEQTWILAWVQHTLLAHPASLFDAPIFYPARGVLAYQDNLVPIAVLMYPVQAISHNPLVVYNVAVLLAFPLSALAMYPLALYVSGDRRAAFLAGLIFAYCPYRERHVEHLNQLSAEAIPLIILFFELARTRGGARYWLALSLSMTLCATLSVYYLAYTLLALGIYSLILLLRRKEWLAAGSLCGIWAGAIGLVPVVYLLLPYLHTQQTVGAERRLSDVVYFSADLRDFLHTGSQSLLYGWSDGLWRIPPLEVRVYLFPGWLALALAILGIRFARRVSSRTEGLDRRWPLAPIYGLVAAIMALLELGPYLRFFGTLTQLPLPYFIVYFFLPGYSGFRDIARIDQVLMAFLAAAAAVGAAGILRRLKGPLVTRALLLLTALLMLEYWTIQKPLFPVLSGSAVPAVYRWLDRQPPGVVAELPMCGLPGQYCLEEASYMYYSSYHWHPIVNGGGGFFPRGWNDQIIAVQSYPSATALAALRRVQVRYLVIHANFQHIAMVRRIVAAAHGYSAELGGQVVRIGPDIVVELGSRGVR